MIWYALIAVIVGFIANFTITSLKKRSPNLLKIVENILFEVDEPDVYYDDQNRLHRIDGPAVVFRWGMKEWWENGEFIKREYHNKKGELHRTSGAAIIFADGSKRWHQNGKLHREDGPAIECADGSKYWFKDGLRHREDGPVIEMYLPFSDGTKHKVLEWHENGKHKFTRRFNEKDQLHCDYGPAEERADGIEIWCKNGVAHRENGPAIKIPEDGVQLWISNGKVHRKGDAALIKEKEGYYAWWEDGKFVKSEYRNKKGQLHRENGPAIEYCDGSQIWMQNGQRHREYGPAFITNGTTAWYLNDRYHREGGPAILHSDGTQSWYKDGKPHRIDGPAITRKKENGLLMKEWFLDGILQKREYQKPNGVWHNTKGPAIEFASGTCMYYLDGIWQETQHKGASKCV